MLKYIISNQKNKEIYINFYDIAVISYVVLTKDTLVR